jgi:hypothetical protein
MQEVHSFKAVYWSYTTNNIKEVMMHEEYARFCSRDHFRLISIVNQLLKDVWLYFTRTVCNIQECG